MLPEPWCLAMLYLRCRPHPHKMGVPWGSRLWMRLGLLPVMAVVVLLQGLIGAGMETKQVVGAVNPDLVLLHRWTCPSLLRRVIYRSGRLVVT